MVTCSSDVLYHYCSQDTFYNIVSNNSLWLSDVSKSNDSMELRWINERCKYYILKVWSDYVKVCCDAGKFKVEDFDRYQHIKESAEAFSSRSYGKCWSFCLSEKCDDLGQWRGYADDGAGISFGIRPKVFEPLVENKKLLEDSGLFFSFDRVCYDQEDIESFFYETCGLEKINVDTDVQEVEQLLSKAILFAYLVTPFYKNSSFAEEREWRLIQGMTVKQLKDGEKPDQIKENQAEPFNLQYGYTIKNGDLVSHVSCSLKNLKDSITEIYLGPKCKWSVYETKLFLISVGWLENFNDESSVIKQSVASYR